jgi:hypothetical protein
MIKHTTKPIIFDKDKFFKDLNHWTLIDDSSWAGLDYGNDGTSYYDFLLIYLVGDNEVNVWVEVVHTWKEDYDPGDYDRPPMTEIYREEVNVSVINIYRNDEPIDLSLIIDLVNRLEFYIKDSVIG